jgi:hypothetical protein
MIHSGAVSPRLIHNFKHAFEFLKWKWLGWLSFATKFLDRSAKQMKYKHFFMYWRSNVIVFPDESDESSDVKLAN